MQKYQDNVQTLDGRAIVGASVTVTEYPGGAPATVYNSNGSGVITQPILTNGDGEFAFYAANGRYQLQVTGGGISVAQTITDIVLFDPADGVSSGDIDYSPNFTMGVVRTQSSKNSEIVSVRDVGMVGSGDESAKFQSLLDDLNSSGGGEVIVPWLNDKYLLGTGILIPSNVTIRVLGTPATSQGLTNTYTFEYTGSGAAFALKDGEADTAFSRGISLIGVGVNLQTAGATAFRLRRARDIYFQSCTARITANNQTGFHIKGERDGGTFLGVFDSTFIRVASYASNTALTGVVHYKLTGTLDDGQANSNQFFGARAGGAGTGVYVTNSYTNSFYNLELEALAEDGVVCDTGATFNSFHDVYFGDMPPGWSGVTYKVFRCLPGSDFNRMHNYKIGSPGARGDLILDATNYADHVQGDRYVGASGIRGYGVSIEGETQRRSEITDRSLAFRLGVSGSMTKYAGPDVQQLNTLTLSASVTPSLDSGWSMFLNINAATNPTINSPTGTRFDGQIFQIEIVNTSGGARTLVWNGNYVTNSLLTTSLTAGQRVTAHFMVRGTLNVLIGAPAVG